MVIHITVKDMTAFNINKRIVHVFLPSALSLYVHGTAIPRETVLVVYLPYNASFFLLSFKNKATDKNTAPLILI
jgi:hypothetical protein